MMMKISGSQNESYNKKVDEYNDLAQRMDDFKKKNFLYRWFFHGKYQSMKIELTYMLKSDYWC